MGGWKQLMVCICTIRFSRRLDTAKCLCVQGDQGFLQTEDIKCRPTLSIYDCNFIHIALGKNTPCSAGVLAWADVWRKVR